MRKCKWNRGRFNRISNVQVHFIAWCSTTEVGVTMKTIRVFAALVACVLTTSITLTGCGASGTSESAAPSVDLSKYTDLVSGRVIVIGSDGEETDWELDDVDDNQVAFEEDAEGATIVVSATVLATKSDFQLNSGNTVEAALQLAATETVMGHPAATALTVEVDPSVVSDQGIEKGDQVLVASTNWDVKYDEMRAPVEVQKIS